MTRSDYNAIAKTLVDDDYTAREVVAVMDVLAKTFDNFDRVKFDTTLAGLRFKKYNKQVEFPLGRRT